MNRKLLVPVALLSLLLSGCTPTVDERTDYFADSSVDESASAPSPAVSDVATDDRAELAGLPHVSWSEGDVTGNLEMMVLMIDRNGLVTVQAKGPTSDAGVFAYTATVGERYQVGLKSVDGDVGIFVYDFETASQTNFKTGYVFSDGQVSFRVPGDAFPELRLPFSWTGALTVDGTDTGFATGREITQSDD